MMRLFAGAAATVLMALSLGACQAPAPAKPAADTGKIADAVKADDTQLVADYNAHDAAKVGSHNTADAVMMFHGAPNATGAAGAAALKQTFATTPDLHLTLSDPTVDVPASGDMAVLHSTYVVNFTDPKTKKPVTEAGNYLAGYKPQADGSWKIVWGVVSETAPAPAAPPAKKG